MDDNENKGKVADWKQSPVIETQISRSKDGRWIIHRTVITDIKPVAYFEKVLHPDR